jgi:hypothetical protein
VYLDEESGMDASMNDNSRERWISKDMAVFWRKLDVMAWTSNAISQDCIYGFIQDHILD